MERDLKEMRQLTTDLRSFNKSVRRAAVTKIGMIGGDEAIKVLINVVKNPHEDLIARGNAALMLGKLGDSRAVQPLIEALNGSGFHTPLYAAQSLGKLGDNRAIMPLLRASECGSDKVREAALKSLQQLGYQKESEKVLTL